ncbi:MAG: response regulator transcription factor [Hyphomicrobiaceae bacterium]|nr:response regulator transcription factor [Hyphomicrobiaceae bacterium]
MSERPTIHIVDDDPSIRKSLARLVGSVGYRCVGYGSAEDFLRDVDADASGCVVIDLELPDMDGFGLHDALSSGPCALPAIFLTGTGDIPASVRAMKAGAVDFLAKPVEDEVLLETIEEALARNAATRASLAASDDLRYRLVTLTPRERQVLDLVVLGRQSKEIAAELGTAVKTIKVHRASMMQKMGMPNLAYLVRAMVEFRSKDEGL